MTWVVDASVAIKWLVDEPGRTLARNLLDKANDFYAPDFVLIETGNVLWKKVRHREITRDQASLGIEALPWFFESFVPSAALVDHAMQIAFEMDHSVYDCLYLACAEDLNASLVTAGRSLSQKSKNQLFARSCPCTCRGHVQRSALRA